MLADRSSSCFKCLRAASSLVAAFSSCAEAKPICSVSACSNMVCTSLSSLMVISCIDPPVAMRPKVAQQSVLRAKHAWCLVSLIPSKSFAREVQYFLANRIVVVRALQQLESLSVGIVPIVLVVRTHTHTHTHARARTAFIPLATFDRSKRPYLASFSVMTRSKPEILTSRISRCGPSCRNSSRCFFKNLESYFAQAIGGDQRVTLVDA
jgi:hypothetical protein